MDNLGLREGDEVVLTLRLNKELLVDVVLLVPHPNVVETRLYVDGDEKLIVAKEAISAVLAAVDYKMELPSLRRMLQARIAELKELADEEESEPPYPTDEGDIPF